MTQNKKNVESILVKILFFIFMQNIEQENETDDTLKEKFKKSIKNR